MHKEVFFYKFSFLLNSACEKSIHISKYCIVLGQHLDRFVTCQYDWEKEFFWKNASLKEIVLIQKVTQLLTNTKMIIIQGLSELQNWSKDTVWFLLFQTTNCFAFHSFSFRFRGGFWFSTSCYGYTFSIRVVPWSSRKLFPKSSYLRSFCI